MSYPLNFGGRFAKVKKALTHQKGDYNPGSAISLKKLGDEKMTKLTQSNKKEPKGSK